MKSSFLAIVTALLALWINIASSIAGGLLMSQSQDWSYSTTCNGYNGGGACHCFNNNPPTVGYTRKGPILLAPAQQLLALNPLTGTLLWQGGVNATDNQGITASPLLTSSGTVVYTVQGTFVVLDGATGRQIWNHSFVSVNGSFLYVTFPSILTPDERILIGYGADNSGLTANAFDFATGKLLWVWYGANIYEYSNAVLKDGVFVTGDSSVYGVNATTGKQLWNFTFNSSSACQLGAADDESDGAVYVPLLNGSTVAVEAKTGKVLWTSASVCGWRAGPMAVANGSLFVLSDCGTVSKINARTGAIDWTVVPTQGQATGVPAFADEDKKVLLVAFYGGGPIVAISTSTGNTLYNITGNAPGGVAVFEGAAVFQDQCGVYSELLPRS